MKTGNDDIEGRGCAAPPCSALAGEVAAQIVFDYHGITIGGEEYEISTDQLMIRIERALIAAINGELHLEPKFSLPNTATMASEGLPSVDGSAPRISD